MARIIRDEIDEAIRRGDYVKAGYLERERNQKIDNKKLPYAKTNEYTPYLDRDYGDEILAGIRRGDSSAVAEASKYREQKSALPGYTQYNNDDISRKAQSYTEFDKVLNQPFSYENGKAQLDARQRELDNLIGDLRNYKEFEYNAETDPAYAELAKLYTRNGQRAMQDTLGEISARTGGLASSYAATAGNQAYANYMSELGGKIPELRQIAYQMYQDKYNRALQGAQLAQNRYESDLARFNNERNFAYNLHGDQQNMAYNRMRDMTAGERYNEELDYARQRDAKADEIAQREWDYGVKNDEYNKALAKAQTLGAAGNFDAYKDLDYTDDQIAIMKRAYQQEQALKQKKASGSSSSPKSTKTSSKYDDVVEELWGTTDSAVIDSTLKKYVAMKAITQEEADYIRSEVFGDVVDYGSRYDNVALEAREMKTRGYDKQKIVEFLDKQSESDLTDEGFIKILQRLFPDER